MNAFAKLRDCWNRKRQDVEEEKQSSAHGAVEVVATNNNGAKKEVAVNAAESLGSGEIVVLTDKKYTAKAWPTQKKWLVLAAMMFVQISQNYNAAVYPNVIPDLTKKFGITHETANLGQMIFLVMYAFGCELWAPFSEELGRKWVLQSSLLLVNIFQALAGAAPSWNIVFAARGLGGLSSAGGSVTLGMIADMFEPETQFQAVAFTCFASVAGSVFAPIISGAVSQYVNGYWTIWISVILGVATQAIHLFVPETRPESMLDKKAKQLRKEGQDVSGPWEAEGSWCQRFQFRKVVAIMWRPYWMLFTEPIVLFNSLLSGFSDSLIFSGLESFALILAKWNFSTALVGFSFVSLMLGYLIAYTIGALHYRLSPVRAQRNNETPEERLWLLMLLVPACPLGLIGLSFASLGPDYGVPWIVPLLMVLLVGIANYAIYLHTSDYLIAAYGTHAASATGGNGFCRDFLAGIAALYTQKMYKGIAVHTAYQLVWPTFILGSIGCLLAGPVYVFYFKGAWFRKRSKYAMKLEAQRAEENDNGGGFVAASGKEV